MEHFVFLESSRGEEPFATDCAEELSGQLLLRLVGVEGDHVSLEVGRHPHTFAAEVTVRVLLLVVFHHVKIQLVFEIEELLANVTL